MTVSIIIAVKTWQENLEECVARCLELDYSDFEIIILPDNPIAKTLVGQRIKIIPTGLVSPGRKRDMAIEHSKGEILAFLDDDVYPRKDWLKKAMVDFADSQVAAVGGPAITAETDNLFQKASGLVYSSILVSGKYAYRYLPGKRAQVDDYPSCNFLVRKSVMQELGGFNTNFWPGEDTKLCLDITDKSGKTIIYDPTVVVYHHRRALFLPHLKQIASYGLHRGYFVKRYPQSSLKVSYFIPTFLLLTLLSGGILSAIFYPFRLSYFLFISVYLFLVFIFSISNGLRMFSLLFFGIISSHICYGFYFLKGLLSPRLKEE